MLPSSSTKTCTPRAPKRIFLRQKIEESKHATRDTPRAGIPVLSHHLRAQKSRTVSTKASSGFQQRQGQRPRRATGQKGAPSAPPSMASAGANGRGGFMSDLRRGQLTQEVLALPRPQASDFAGKDHQRAAVGAGKSSVRSLSASSRPRENSPVCQPGA